MNTMMNNGNIMEVRSKYLALPTKKKQRLLIAIKVILGLLVFLNVMRFILLKDFSAIFNFPFVAIMLIIMVATDRSYKKKMISVVATLAQNTDGTLHILYKGVRIETHTNAEIIVDPNNLQSVEFSQSQSAFLFKGEFTHSVSDEKPKILQEWTFYVDEISKAQAIAFVQEACRQPVRVVG